MRWSASAIVIVSLLAFGCRNDEQRASGDPASSPRSIVGTWQRLFIENGWEETEFKSDGTYLSRADRQGERGKTLRKREEGTWTLEGTKLSFNLPRDETGWYLGDKLQRDISRKIKGPFIYVMEVEWLSANRITLDDDAGSPIAFERK